jgi:hypothetical protein
MVQSLHGKVKTGVIDPHAKSKIDKAREQRIQNKSSWTATMNPSDSTGGTAI